MKTLAVVLVVSMLGTLASTCAADAGARFHQRGGGGRFAHPGPARGHSFHGHPLGRHRFFPRPFTTFGVVLAPPVVVYAPAPVLAAPPPYVGAPTYVLPAAPPPAYMPPPPPPRVVEYPTGRYELRGDGVTAPYTWVWIPNPPPPPPPPPPAAPAPSSGNPASSGAPAARRMHVYRWADEDGVVHWTDRLETVPRRYRDDARRDPGRPR